MSFFHEKFCQFKDRLFEKGTNSFFHLENLKVRFESYIKVDKIVQIKSNKHISTDKCSLHC